MRVGWGIDVGVGSLGFAVIELDERDRPARLVDGVSLVYPAPTGGAERTRHKSMRTQNKRYAKRIKALRRELTELLDLDPGFDNERAHPDLTDGLKSDGKKRKNTSRVRLRAHGLRGELSAGDLARAILHIAKNRGQRLTRGIKDDTGSDAARQKKSAQERQSIADTANSTKSELAALGERLKLGGNAHPSQLLMEKSGNTGTTRLKKDREGMPVFTRSMVQDELKALLKAQEKHHKVLTNEVRDDLAAKVFEEAEATQQSVGNCRYRVCDATTGDIETRLPRGSDLFQRKRIFEEVNNLRLISSGFSPDEQLCMRQRNCVASLLLDGCDLTATQVRKALNLGRDALAYRTSLDISRKGRKVAGKLQGHPLAAAMRKAGALEEWRGFNEEMRERIAGIVRTEDDVDVLKDQLEALGFEANVIKALSDARLPTTYSAAGRTATQKLLEELKADVISNHEAEKRAKLNSPDPPRSLERLPYYGEILQGSCVGGNGDPGSQNEVRLGRIPNPVVHVSLNQLRKTANAYLHLYGKPRRICIELARDLNKSAKDREEEEKQADRNRKANEKYIERLGVHKRKLTREDRKRLKLHRMQNGECLYTGRPISTEQLFDGSIQIDHILPQAETRDDGISNLALVFAEANQHKQKRAPFEAFRAGYLDQDYEHILKRAWERGGGVYWRFKEDAMERYRNRDEFEARFLNDTRYTSRMAVRYLKCVCDDPNGVVCLNGRITSDLRHEWRLKYVIREIMEAEGRLTDVETKTPKDGETLNEIRDRRKRADKIRWDHRHHLLDAIVAACTTRSDVQRLQTLAAQDTGEESRSEILARVRRADAGFRNAGMCWRPEFRRTVKAFLQGQERHGAMGRKSPVTSVVVKADHDPRGQLHKETNYGLICEHPDNSDKFVARHHDSILDLTAKQIEEIGIPETAIKAVEKAKAQGVRFWWGGRDPVSSLRNNLAHDLEGMRKELLELMEIAPPEVLENATTESVRKKARAEWAKKQYIAKTGRRRFTRVEIKSLRIRKGLLGKNKKPIQANPTGGNDRLVYFVTGKGVRGIEIVSKLDANKPGFQEQWRCDGGQLLFVLRKNDLVEMLDDPERRDSPRRLYRTASFSNTGSIDLEFVPVEEARSRRPPGSVRIRSEWSFSKRAPVIVVCDPTGRVRWRSPRLN